MSKESEISRDNGYYIDASVNNLPELTWRGCLLATIITLAFTAGNVYMGLKISLTFGTAIPAAVISMAVLRYFRDSNILENTTVQTFTSAAGAISGVIFVLPAFMMLGIWQSFPIWETILLCATGGLLGVMLTVPLRRALVVQSKLPYPEGVAAAEILRAGNQADDVAADKNKLHVRDITYGTVIAGIFTLFSRGFHVFSEALYAYTKVGAGLLSFSMDYSMALVGAGFLMRYYVGFAMFVGFVLAWGVILPTVSWDLPMNGSIENMVGTLWVTKVRFVGIGTIAVGALWSVILLMKPVVEGVRSSLRALAQIRLSGHASIPRTEKDIPITWVVGIIVLLAVPLIVIFYRFITDVQMPLTTSEMLILTTVCVVFVIVLSFITAAVCGYMAGLIGSSNSPLSSVGIISTISASLLVLLFAPSFVHERYSELAIALALYMTAVVIAAGSTSNDNLQDLKTGQMVGATPWRQQIALMLGVLVGSLVIPWILQTLYTAYGFTGALPRPDMNPVDALSAPQATMMLTVASGVIRQNLEWQMISLGAVIAVIALIIDATFIKRFNWRFSVLAMGSGMYLPMAVTSGIVLGSILSFLVDRALKRKAKEKNIPFETYHRPFEHRATLFASGLIVGESLVGLLIALIIASTGSQNPIALVGYGFDAIAQWLGITVFFGILIYYYRYSIREDKSTI